MVHIRIVQWSPATSSAASFGQRQCNCSGMRHPFSPTERRVQQQQQQQQYMVIVKKNLRLHSSLRCCCVSVFVSREMQKYSTRARDESYLFGNRMPGVN
uniref:Uncharacterized protein n=1 Tax=Trichogramma kaykai TaxID=54128 RepID=A0ABD2XD30_9HYME